jgi:glutamate dehydrogenase/leucine dehydrogenase
VRVQQLESTDGFVLYDLDGAPTSVGVVRLAPKVLRDSAELLARSVTYAFATFGLQMGGASAGVNATPDRRDEALTSFMEEVAPLVAERRLVLDAGLGVTDGDLSALNLVPLDRDLTGRGVAAAADAALGGLTGRRLAAVGKGPEVDAASAAARELGAEVIRGELDAECDVLAVAGKPGMVDHETATAVRARVLVPVTPAAVTARGLAVLGRAGVVVVPDFVSTAGPLLARFDGGRDPLELVGEAAARVAADEGGGWLAACLRAEEFLATWREELPFGRPLA